MNCHGRPEPATSLTLPGTFKAHGPMMRDWMKLITGITLLMTGLVSCGETKKQQSTVNIQYPTPYPDTTAAIFLPGIVSTDGLDFNAAFSPDGKTFYFARSKNRKYIILETRFDGTKWSAATPSALFDTAYSNADPFITTNGDIYFISNRPKDKTDTTGDYDIYRIARQENKWLEPENLTAINSDSTEYYVSVSSSGNIYFASYREGNLDLFMSRKKDAHYEIPFNLGKTINSDSDEHDPLIAPDESWLIFTSSRPGGFGEADLYISRREKDQWQQPQNMGKKINTTTYEYCPNLSPDGKYFFFSSESEVKWISSSILTPGNR
jgi:Tol biopolymer transport system component